MSNGGTMFVKTRVPRLSNFAQAFGLIAAASLSFAWADPVKIAFLPPPMEGTISLGVYDSAGKLVRVLAKEAETGTFTAGDDGLETQWDGKDDQGAVCSAGTYRARGVMVGDLGVEGVDFVGNDWVTNDDSPHIARITDLLVNDSGVPIIGANVSGSSLPAPAEEKGIKLQRFFGINLRATPESAEEFEVQLSENPQMPTLVLREYVPKKITAATPWAYGVRYSESWVIDGKNIKLYNIGDKLIRSFSPNPGDPPPVKLAASPTEEKVYVLYENAQMQRLRGYDFTGVKPGGAPKVLFENDIVFSDRYEQIASQLKFPDEKPFAPVPVLTVTLPVNPLLGGKPGTLPLRAVVNKEGAWLAAADGLPLCRVSDTPALRWAALGRPGPNKPVTFFNSDGAAVEQFQISAIGNMMTFDAGSVPWTPPAATPSPSPSPTASPTPSLSPAATRFPSLNSQL